MTIADALHQRKPEKDDLITPGPSGLRNNCQSNREVQRDAYCSRPVHTKLKLRSRETSTCTEGATVNSDTEQDSIDRNGAYQLQYRSNRRPITEEEKEMALQMAQAALTSESFIVVMRPTHVYRRFYMAVPSEWAAGHLPEESQDVILRVKENAWCAKYYTRKARIGGGLTRGWMNFAVENNLEEFDVCVFHLARQEANTIVLDVSIFRVVQEVMPLTRVNSASPRVKSAISRRGRPPKNAKRKPC
ncbi:hypothetical protein L1049_026796 [Liquidambar formosana]|uniref:TF-B3 domain-containing protein n=1 Tax=Liquidambar formosana TaxID=63359 RepID=A0AAP0NFL2_LIQFO